MAEKRESYQLASQGGPTGAVQEVPSQQSVDLLIRLLQELERRSVPTATTLPPEVERDIAAVGAAFASIENALSLRESPIVISSVEPNRGPAGTQVTIKGSHLLPGASVRFGNATATEVSVVNLTEIKARAPQGEGVVDVVVDTLAGSAIRQGGYTY